MSQLSYEDGKWSGLETLTAESWAALRALDAEMRRLTLPERERGYAAKYRAANAKKLADYQRRYRREHAAKVSAMNAQRWAKKKADDQTWNREVAALSAGRDPKPGRR